MGGVRGRGKGRGGEGWGEEGSKGNNLTISLGRRKGRRAERELEVTSGGGSEWQHMRCLKESVESESSLPQAVHPTVSCTSCVSLGRLFNLPAPQFFDL